MCENVVKKRQWKEERGVNTVRRKEKKSGRRNMDAECGRALLQT